MPGGQLGYHPDVSHRALGKVVAGLVVLTVGVHWAVRVQLDKPRGNAKLEVGQLLETFELSDRDGNTVDLHTYAADKKVVLVTFWAAWCRPCRMEMPYLIASYGEMAQDGLGILAVNVDKDPAEREAYLAQHQLPFPVLLDPQGALLEQYGFDALPAAVAVDSHGVIKDVLEGAENQRLRFFLPGWVSGKDGAFQFGWSSDDD